MNECEVDVISWILDGVTLAIVIVIIILDNVKTPVGYGTAVDECLK